MSGAVIFNKKTGQLRITQAKQDGIVYKKYLSDGYKKIGYATGFNIQVWGIVDMDIAFGIKK
jgi:hypothetical protein